MSTQPWSIVVQQWTPDGLFDEMDRNAVRQLVGAVSDEECLAIVEKRIARMTRFYRQSILKLFADTRMETIRSFIAVENERMREARTLVEESRRASGENFPQVGAPVSALSIGLGSINAPADGERYFFTTSAPDASTYANNAENGEWLLVTSVNPATNGLYINRGTKATPDWQRFTSSSLIDYLTNPEELLDCGYTRVVYYLKNYGTVLDEGDFDGRIQNMPKAAKLSKDQATEEEMLAFSLIVPDTSGDGIISESEASTMADDQYVF